MHQRWLLGAAALGVVWGAVAIAFDAPVLVLDFLLHLGPTLAGVAALVALIGWRPAGPASFEIRAETFVAPTNRRRTIEIAALVLVLTSQAALAIDRLADGGGVFDGLLSVVFGLLAAALLARSVLVPTTVELNADGLRIPGRLHRVDVPWAAIRPGTPWAPVLRTQRLELLIGTGYLVRPPSERRQRLDVPIDVLDIHPWFLADAIRYYVAHPEHRAAIGRPAELERLSRRLRDGGAPPALPAGPTVPVVRQAGAPATERSTAAHRR
ncbi:hypothetical protein [Asanoa siamensis]|uniref:PH (Pleckstrin Homology) domain-containing protein n=1 Tax=Asanoa siamensis TaxID=926357 RepID=A0ABQ4CH66_9ACTN|nr:hypothetical protein [Asanoa siamensis]GIF70641.1 hypothetical protein Asi02nite_01590 [Asanoa siamensis]